MDEKELTLKEREIDENIRLKEKELDLQEAENKLIRREHRIRFGLGLIPVLIALIAASVSVYQVFAQRGTELEIQRLELENQQLVLETQLDSQAKLKQLEIQSNLILGAVEIAGGDVEKSIANLQFFLTTGILEDETGAIKAALSRNEVPLSSTLDEIINRTTILGKSILDATELQNTLPEE